MNEAQDAQVWAEQEFGQPPRLEKRLRKRLVKTAALIAQRPSGSLPQRLDWNDLRGMYRLVDHPQVTPDVLQDTHRCRTLERMNRPEPILIPHDTTQMDFSKHGALKDKVGPIGDGDGYGFLQHNSIAIDPTRHEILGLIYQQTWIRIEAPPGENRDQRRKREEKESRVWVNAIQAIGPAPLGTQWIDVCDSGGDFFDIMAASLKLNHHFLIRLYQNRCVEVPIDQRPENPDESEEDETRARYLLTEARALKPQDWDRVEVVSKGGRPGRTAQVALASIRLHIAPPTHTPKWKGHTPIATTVIRIWEPNPPPDVEPLEWILGTDLPVEGEADRKRFRDWYALRWPTMEDYHKAQKTGCGIERMRFETATRMLAAMALLSVVAIRVLNLRWLRDSQPEADASTVATDREIEIVKKLTKPRGLVLTVRQFVDGVAKLGGYLGRKCDGPPGWQSLWRGYQRLADILLGMELREEPDPTDEFT